MITPKELNDKHRARYQQDESAHVWRVERTDDRGATWQQVAQFNSYSEAEYKVRQLNATARPGTIRIVAAAA